MMEIRIHANDATLWSVFWVGAVSAVIVLIVAIWDVNTNADRLTKEAIAGGANPIAAGCAFKSCGTGVRSILATKAKP